MSWGTNVNLDLYLSRMTFENKQELINKIDDCNKTITYIKTKLLMYSASNPKDIIGNMNEDPWDSCIEMIQFHITEQLTYLQEEITLLTKLELFLEHLEDHPEISIEQYNPYKQK